MICVFHAKYLDKRREQRQTKNLLEHNLRQLQYLDKKTDEDPVVNKIQKVATLMWLNKKGIVGKQDTEEACCYQIIPKSKMKL